MLIPLQKVWSETPLITGIGLTVIEKVFEDPAHVFDIGVTVIKPEICNMPVLIAENGKMLPIPDKPRPIELLLLLH